MVQNIVENIYDKGTFSELNKFMITPNVGALGDGLTTGYGAINTRLVYGAIVDDEVLSGAFSSVQGKKFCSVVDLAVKNGAPFLYVVKSSSIRLSEELSAIALFGQVFKTISNAKGKIPLVCLVTGNCFGLSSILTQLFDFVYVTDSAAAGVSLESVIKANDVNADTKEYGKSSFLAKNGFASIVLKDDEIAKIRDIFAILPDNNNSGAPDFSETYEVKAPFNNSLNDIAENSGNLTADQLVDFLRDKDMPFVKLYEGYTDNVSVSIGVLCSVVCGFVAFNQVSKQDEKSSKLISKLVTFCDSFNIPVVSLISGDGYKADINDEKNNVSDAIADMVYAYASSEIPKITVICGDIYGSSLATLASKTMGSDYVIAWNKADVNYINPKAAVEIWYHDEIVNSENPAETRAKLLTEYEEKNKSPIFAASIGLVDDIIMPGETKAKVAAALNMMK